MAKTIYDYWFVQFDFPDENGNPYKSSGGKMVWNDTTHPNLPAGWNTMHISELLEKQPSTTKLPTSAYNKFGQIPIVDQSANFIAGYTNDKTSILHQKAGYIVFGDHTRIVKYICFPFARGADGTQIISSNNVRMPNELFYQIIKHIDLSNYGYARHFKFLKESVIVLPTEAIANEYVKQVNKLHEYQTAILKENQYLTYLRDWLLPMLMNGQATIED